MVTRFETPDKRIFTAAELELCAASANPSESLAGRWCAKEAVVKAMSRHILLSPREVEVLADSAGRPLVRFLRSELEHIRCDVSITHGGGIAAAIAAAWQGPSRGGN
jgi:phosphopantetheine--protein transferase-like protein